MTQRTKDRRPTLADVAKRAGVSRSLVSLAIRGEGYVRAESRERIAKAAAELNYQPNLAARSLASAQAGYIGIVVGQVTNPLQAEIAKWASVLSAEQGLTALVSLDAESDENAEAAIRALMAHRVSGVMLVGAPYEKAAIARVAAEVPSVYIGRLLKVVDIDSVTTDNILGANMAVDHLVSLGHRHIAHVDGGASPGAERMCQGYREAMERHGLAGSIRIIPGAYTIDAGAAAGRELFGSGTPAPDAVFASSDLAAIGVINEAARHGISIPGNLHVVGYDDVTLAGTETLSLTSIHQSARDLAEAGVSAIIRRLRQPEASTNKMLVPPRLVARRSTGTLPTQ
jgi:DNA-binding LacI/PurR family transcriptional regulator